MTARIVLQARPSNGQTVRRRAAAAADASRPSALLPLLGLTGLLLLGLLLRLSGPWAF